MTLPAYPLAVQPSAHIRLTYTREDSLSPIRSAVPTAQSSEPRRFSHSRGRPGALPTPLLPFLAHLPLSFETPLLTLLGTLPSILVCCALSTALARIGGFDETPLAVGSLGATAVLLYAVPEGPLSQPRNLVGGHMISALVGCVVSQLFALDPRFSERTSSEGLLLDNITASTTSWGSLAPVSASLAVTLAVLAMQLTGTVHPPGGATARRSSDLLILPARRLAIAAFHQRPTPRWTYLLLIFLPVIWMGVWALVVNNLGRRRYPAYWGTPPPLDAPPVVGAPAPASPLDHDPKPHAEHLEPSPSHFSPSAPSAHDASSTQREVNSSIEREQERDLQARWLGRMGEGDEVAIAKSEGVGAEEGDGRRAGSWKMKMEEEEERGLRARR
ncbi:hypothetical protein JCM11641_008226 [Rhodosporidiobolus odoratus]